MDRSVMEEVATWGGVRRDGKEMWGEVREDRKKKKLGFFSTH